jgi:hypothetical protein
VRGAFLAIGIICVCIVDRSLPSCNRALNLGHVPRLQRTKYILVLCDVRSYEEAAAISLDQLQRLDARIAQLRGIIAHDQQILSNR